MKTIAIAIAVGMIATAAFAGLWKRGDEVRDLVDSGPWAAKGWTPVQIVGTGTQTVVNVTSNDITEVATRRYLIANRPAGVTAASTPQQVRTAWSNAVAAASATQKPFVLSEQACWMPAWFIYKTMPDALADTVTNITVTVTNNYGPRAL